MDFQSRLNLLHKKGSTAQLCSNIDQTTGLITIASGGLICALGVPTAGVVPLALGVISYLAATFVEAKKTGELRPIPFVETGVGDLLAQADTQNGYQSQSADLTPYHYLSAKEKSEYVLLSLVGQDLQNRIQAIPADQQDFVWNRVLSEFHALYSQHIKMNPYALSGVEKGALIAHFLPSAKPVTDIMPYAQQSQVVSDVEKPITTDNPEPVKTTADSENTISALFNATIAKPLQPYLILGAPGSGKGIFACYALTAAAKHHNAEVWVMDSKSDHSEAGYWFAVDRHYLKEPCLPDFNFGTDIIGVVGEFESRVSARKNGTESKDRPLILFLDEVNTIVTKLSNPQRVEFGSKIINLASQARSQNAAVWLGGQCAILELLGIKGETNRDIFTQVVCVNGDQPEKAQAILGNLGMDKALLVQCKPGNRYWITRRGLIQTPTLKEPPARDWGNNVIDLRPEVEPIKVPVELINFDGAKESDVAFLDWLKTRSDPTLTLRQVVMSSWAKAYGHDKEVAMSAIAYAIAEGKLSEIDGLTFQVVD